MGTRAVRRLSENQLPQTPVATAGWDDWAGALLAGHHVAQSSGMRAVAAQAVAEALDQAALLNSTALVRSRIGVVLGASKPPLRPWFDALPEVWHSRTSVTSCEEMFSLSSSASHIADVFDFQGPLLTHSAACATGLVSIIRGVELIRQGDCDAVVVGGADSSLDPVYLAAYRRMGVLAPMGQDPGRGCRPFDSRRSGFAVGEGAAALILEDLDRARSRGATILAEILGAGLTSDNDSLVDVDSSGRSLARALGDALKRSGVGPRQIDAASLHGTGTRLNDICETNALKKACGEHARQISCFSIKGAIGHLMGAAGSVETATLIQAMQHGIVPPTVNLEEPDPECDLDYTPGRPRTRPINVAVKLSLGFGGTCAALVLRRPNAT